jgi:steroid delta-isomerase-like uncharacterized protein
MSIEENKAIVARYLSAWETGDTAILRDVLAPDFIDHAHPDWQAGAAEIQDNLRMFRAAFSDIEYHVDDMIAEGESVSFRVTIRARHTGQFSRFPPTGKTVEYHAMDVLRIVAGRITELWTIAATLGWVQQLGATLHFPADARPAASSAEES